MSTLTSIFNKAIGAPEDGYERLLKLALEKVLDYIEDKAGNYTESNEDMLNYDSEFQDEEDAEECFCKKFKEKTGLEWENRNEPTIGKKYRFIQQNFGEKKLGYTSAKWQYWVDDQVDGKADGWYDYSKEGSQQVERLYQESLINPRISNRIVGKSFWKFLMSRSKVEPV